jgi:hypothetical protein
MSNRPDVNVESNGLGCGLIAIGICMLLAIIHPSFWPGLKSVVEVFRP